MSYPWKKRGGDSCHNDCVDDMGGEVLVIAPSGNQKNFDALVGNALIELKTWRPPSLWRIPPYRRDAAMRRFRAEVRFDADLAIECGLDFEVRVLSEGTRTDLETEVNNAGANAVVRVASLPCQTSNSTCRWRTYLGQVP